MRTLNNARRGRPKRNLNIEALRHLRWAGISLRCIARVTGLGYGTIRRALAATSSAEPPSSYVSVDKLT